MMRSVVHWLVHRFHSDLVKDVDMAGIAWGYQCPICKKIKWINPHLGEERGHRYGYRYLYSGEEIPPFKVPKLR